jgi:hypothetical protein
MKGKLRLKIFEFLENAAQTAEDLLFVFSLPYGTSFLKMETLLNKYHHESERGKFRKKIDRKTKLRFYDLVARLKKEGLISGSQKAGKKIFKLTNKGDQILVRLRLLSLPAGDYGKVESDNTFKIIIFDIPEEEARKRFWLRRALLNLGFNMLQKSVWVGKTKLPEEFITDLKMINILSFVEIFAITKQGSSNQL